MKTYPRGSVEFHETPLLNGTTPVVPTKVAALPWNDPAPAAAAPVWAGPTPLDGKHGLMVGAYSPGYWRTWTKTTDNPESPIVESEPFTVV